MRHFVLIAALCALGQARPEAGYSYSAPAPSAAPSVSYGAPAASFGAANSLDASGAGGFASFAGSAAGGFNGFAGASSGAEAASFSSGAEAFSGDFGGSSAGGAALVQKHIYVHVPPQEPEEYRPQKQIQFAPPQKHYKIIFIKAPTPPTPTAPVIPVQPQNEEKTLVYVLVKKPEEAPEISIPTPAPTQPSKPEVYFIRYRTQQGSSAAAGADFGAAGAGAGNGFSDENLDSVVVGGAKSSGSSFGGASAISGSSAGASASYGPPGFQPGPH